MKIYFLGCISTFQVLGSHMWLVVAALDSTDDNICLSS